MPDMTDAQASAKRPATASDSVDAIDSSKPLRDPKSLRLDSGDATTTAATTVAAIVDAGTLRLNTKILSADTASKLLGFYEASAIDGELTLCEGYVQADEEPFRHVIVQDFIEGDLEALRELLLRLPFHAKSSDLLQLSQSDSLHSLVQLHPTLQRVFDLLRYDVKRWLEAATGFALTDTPDASVTLYRYTDFLHCHDDRMTATRKLAYIWYLGPSDWSDDDGGALELLSSTTGSDGLPIPGQTAESITPNKNQFIYFDVNERSFHRVSEVLSASKQRLAISGWFHTVDDRVDASSTDAVLAQPLPSPLHELVAIAPSNQLLSAVYAAVSAETHEHLSEALSDNGHIVMPQLLATQKYTQLYRELLDCDATLPWRCTQDLHRTGSWSYLSVQDLLSLSTGDAGLPPIARELLEIFRSEKLFALLESLVGHWPTSSQSSASAKRDELNEPHFRLERFVPGNYSMVTSTLHSSQARLDAYYTMCSAESGLSLSESVGGYVSYIDESEDGDEIIRLPVLSNSFSLVLAESDVQHYISYVNDRHRLLHGGVPIYRVYMSIVPPAAEWSTGDYADAAEEPIGETANGVAEDGALANRVFEVRNELAGSGSAEADEPVASDGADVDDDDEVVLVDEVSEEGEENGDADEAVDEGSDASENEASDEDAALL